MDATKIFTVLCAFLLIICLTLSITALTVMRNAVNESKEWMERAEIMVGKFDPLLEENETGSDSSSVSTDEDSPMTDADVHDNRFCIKSAGEKICVYTEEGYLIRTLDVALQTLSDSEQAALADGIFVNSWRELIERIQDLES